MERKWDVYIALCYSQCDKKYVSYFLMMNLYLKFQNSNMHSFRVMVCMMNRLMHARMGGQPISNMPASTSSKFGVQWRLLLSDSLTWQRLYLSYPEYFPHCQNIQSKQWKQRWGFENNSEISVSLLHQKICCDQSLEDLGIPISPSYPEHWR